jgi:predicted MFS family arabinose efflux permease
MADHFGLGASAAGMFGLVGVVGAAGAPLAGRMTDRRGFGFTVGAAVALTAAAFVLMSFWVTLLGLVVGVLLMDLGVQSVQVAAQAKVISLVPAARSRLNTVYMVSRFTGGAAGSALGALAWSWDKWTGVGAFCLLVNAAALLVHYVGVRRHGGR